MYGTVLSFMLSPFAATGDLPAACSFAAPAADPSALVVTLHPRHPAPGPSRERRAALSIDGTLFDAEVRPNPATDARDVLITTADAAGRRIVLALNETGRALLLRETGDGPAERHDGHCGTGGPGIRAWFAR